MGLTGSTDPDVVMQRRQQLADQLGFDLTRSLMTVQEHAANVVTFHRRQPEGGQCVFDTDALATDVPGQAIVTYHADCFPLLFLDAARGVVAGAHAGWRGSLAGVAIQTVQALHLAYGSEPDELDVLIGPGICGRCYQVGHEVADQFIARYVRETIARSAERAGRDPSEVVLVTVTKGFPVARIREALAAGLRILGENRVQEALPKIDEIGRVNIDWHLIGHLQTNKVKFIENR